MLSFKRISIWVPPLLNGILLAALFLTDAVFDKVPKVVEWNFARQVRDLNHETEKPLARVSYPTCPQTSLE